MAAPPGIVAGEVEDMKADDFVLEFGTKDFPQELGRLIDIDEHSPPFTNSQLRRMEAQGLIIISDGFKTYRLTLKATRIYYEMIKT